MPGSFSLVMAKPLEMEKELLGGYGGIQHCLVPAPKHVLLSRNEDGEITTSLFAPEQNSDSMMKVLGYAKKGYTCQFIKY